MKNLRFALVALMFVSGGAFADEEHKDHEPKGKGVESIVKETKSTRRKKVEMCHDCGKPEVNCDCPEEVKAKEAAAKKSAE